MYAIAAQDERRDGGGAFEHYSSMPINQHVSRSVRCYALEGGVALVRLPVIYARPFAVDDNPDRKGGETSWRLVRKSAW